MKVRSDFVTNSSSSSYTIAYTKVDDISSVSLADGNLYFLGDWLCEGRDFFKIESEEILNLIKEAEQNPGCSWCDINIINVLELKHGSELVIDPKNLPSDSPFKVMSSEVDYHTSDNVERFKNRYLYENED